ncbi:hypothetical protein M514_05922, partial [Trichuris suis]
LAVHTIAVQYIVKPYGQHFIWRIIYNVAQLRLCNWLLHFHCRHQLVEIETDIGREGEDEVTAQGPMTTTTTTAAPSRAKRSPPPQPAAKQQKSNKAAGAKKAAKKVGGKIGKGVKFAFKKTKNAANAVKNKVTKKK